MYRGEIQNDSIGGSFHRSLAFSASNSGGSCNDRYESRNFAVGAPLRGGGIGRCEEEEYNCCGLYGRGDDGNDSDSDSDFFICEGGSVPTNPALYEKAKAIVNKSYPKHSAYRSGAYVKKYKEMGGEYRDDGERKLERWFKEDWKDVGNKDYPTYRPTKRISKDTPLTADEIDPQNLSEQIKEKQKIKGQKNLKPFVGKGDGTKRPRSPSPQPPPPPPPPPQPQPPPPPPLPAGDFVCDECGENIRQGTREWRGRAVLADGTPLCGYCADNVSASEGDEDGMSAEEDEEDEEGGGKPFTNKQLTKIILDKNKVIADLEENAYGGNGLRPNEGIGDMFERMRQENKDAERKRDEEDARSKAQFVAEYDEYMKSMGGAMTGGMKKRDFAKEEEDLDVEIEKQRREMEIMRLQREIAEIEARRRALAAEAAQIRERAKTPPRGRGRGRKGGAAKAEPKAPSGVAVAAEILKPVREAIQNGIGDAIYGKSDDPKKQKKGLLGISEEGKEESQKKVMKNIVVPVAKAFNQLKTNVEDAYNQSFNKDKYEADLKERGIKQIKKEEAEAGIVRDKENPMIIIRKPRGMWKADTTDPAVKPYNRERILHYNRGAKTQEETEREIYYIRVPNPIFAAKLRPSFKEFSDAGVKLWTGVEQLKKGQSEDVDGTLKQLQDDPFIFIPEDRAKEIYGQLRQFVADKQDEGVMEGYEDEGWTKGQLKAFSKIDPRTLKGQELIDYKESKLVLDKVTTQNALEKVTKDIAEEEKGKTVIRGERPVRIEPDQARLAKMREAKVRVENRLKELSLRGQQEFKDMMMFSNAEKAKRDAEYYARQNADAQGTINEAQEQAADAAESFKALSPAERSIQLDTYRKDLQEQGFTDEQIEEQIGAVGGAGSDDRDGELVGEGAIEFTLSKVGKSLFNPTGDMTKAGIQTFAPDYDAYGATVAGGRLNAFNLSRSMYNQQQAIDIPDFDLIEDDISLRFYLKDDEDVILVGIRGTDVKSYTDLYTWAVIGAKQDFRMTTRFQDDLQKLLAFQKRYSIRDYYYVATGSSLAGSIADRFLDMGLIEEAITYNPSIEKKYILDADIHNHRVYLDTDPLFILMGQYAPNTEIRKNASRANFFNPSKEKDYLIASHSIFPVYNPAFEGGGMVGAGKTYTIEEWKAIFDAKLEQKRQQIEAREAKKKQTAKAKRERAKAVRDARDEPPPLETPATFRTSRVMKATPPREPEPAPPAPKKRKPRLKVVAPERARVELRQELVAEQPREPEGEFAQEAEPLQLVVAEIEKQPQRAYMRLMKSPQLTDADRRLMMSLQSREMAPMRKVKLLARSGLARKLMEILGIDESAFQTQRARLRIADTMEKRTTGKKVRDIALAPLMDLFDKQEAGLIRFLAGKTDKKDGETILRFIDYVAKKVADCAIGTWVVAERMLSFGPSSWSCAGRNDIIGIEGLVGESNGGSFSVSAQMFLTTADENNVTCLGYVRDEPRFGLNFAQQAQASSFLNDKGQVEERPANPNKNFFFPAIAGACMDMVEKIDGVDYCSLSEKRAGMGYKRRMVWSIMCKEVEPLQKRLKPEQKERIAKAEYQKAKAIGEKVGALVTEYKDIILERGALLVERVEASLTPAQLEAIEAYEVKVSKPVVIAKKKKRLREVEAQLGVIEGMDISRMRRYLMPDVVAREDKIAAKAPSLRAERDKLKREIAALEK